MKEFIKELPFVVMVWLIGMLLITVETLQNAFVIAGIVLAVYVAAGVMLWNGIMWAPLVFAVAIALTLLGILAEAYGWIR